MTIETPSEPVFMYWTPGQPDLTTRDERAERVVCGIAAHPSIDPDSWIEQLSLSPSPLARRPRFGLND